MTILPFLILIGLFLLWITYYIGKNKIKSQKHFFIKYWGALIIVEIIFLLYIRIYGPVQYIPSSFVVNYMWGTIFWIIYIVKCISSNITLMKKLKLIGAAAMLNYIIAPLTFAFIAY